MPTASKSNKKTTYLWVSIIVFIFGIVTIPSLVSRIKNGTIIDNNRLTLTPEVLYGSSEESLAYLMGPEGARHIPDFSFTDQNGNILSPDELKGKVVVLDFFFTTCPTICPRMNRNLVEVQNTFKNEDNFGVASFSIMPETDTPEKLKEYAENYGITNPNWHLMTGDKQDIYNLSNIGFNIFVDVENFEHSGDFALVDKNGFLRSRKDDFGNPKIFYKGVISEQEKVDEDGNPQEISMLKEDIAKLLKE